MALRDDASKIVLSDDVYIYKSDLYKMIILGSVLSFGESK